MVYYRATVAEAFEHLEKGEYPFNVIGNFLDDFYCASEADRNRMVASPLPTSAKDPDNFKWLVYFTAAVDLLCWRNQIPKPDWVLNPIYHLKDPWFMFPGWKLRAWLLTSTPVPFKMRNIFSGENVLTRV